MGVKVLGWTRYLSVLLVVLSLTSCEGFMTNSAASSAENQNIVRAALTREDAVKRLLSRAERALARDRLLQPIHDNAYDHYASVLLVDPGNQEAELGMQAIVLRYLDLARSAAQASRYKEAKQYLDRALSISPDNVHVKSLVQSLRKETAPILAATVISDNAIMLDEGLLSKRSILMVEQLGLLAVKVKREQNTVVIFARNDNEGRWIYQQMREAVTGYLLRGDIQKGSPVRVELLPPM